MVTGLTDAGFAVPTQTEIADEIRADIAASPALGADVNTAPDTPLGQIVDIMAAALSDLWSEAGNVFAAAGILSAGGVPLANLVKRYDMQPHPAEASRMPLTLTGTPSTVIPAGSAVTLSSTGTRWTIESAATIGGGGTVDAYFSCDTTGPTTVQAGATWSIATPVSGWTAVSNAADILADDIGRDAERDAALRARAIGAAKLGTASSAGGVLAGVLAVTDVTEAVVIENESQYTDTEGRAPQSMEVVVRGGADAAIAAAILRRAPAGIQLVTTVTGGNQVTETVVDTAGDNQAITFSRPDLINVWVEVDYRPLPAFPANGAAIIEQAIIDFGNGLGLDSGGVFPPNVEAAIFRAFTGSVFQTFDLRIGLTASPSRADPVPTSRTQIADFDTSRITITRI